MNIKSKWEILTAREKNIISLGGLTIISFICFYGIWVPLQNKMLFLEAHTEKNLALLTWMQEQAPKLKAARLSSQSQNQNQNQNNLPTRSLFSLLDTFFNTADFAYYPVYLQSAGQKNNTEQVSVRFSEVPFDVFVQGIDKLQSQSNIAIASIDVQDLDANGLVKVEALMQG